MLPTELLRVRTRKGQIRPVYADINSANLELARKLLEAVKTHVGKRKGELMEAASSLENTGYDFRLVRGLSLILQRLCHFHVEAAIDPTRARQLIFEEASRRGFVATEATRQEVFRNVAARVGVTEEELERSFQADLEHELVLETFTPIDPTELLKRYNLSLTQTLLFRSTFLEIKVSDLWKEILRDIKFRGLMYFAETRNGVFQITVDGPLSIFKLTQRYGTSMAKILPSIVQAKHWEINGSIVKAGQFGKRLYQLRLVSSQLADKVKPAHVTKREERTSFDSLVEKRFFRDFQSLHSGWKIVREPPPLIVGKHVFIPDFSFEKARMKVYMEIAGFWTKRYLELKIKKLQQLEGVDIIVAANERLACDKLKEVEGNIIFYKKKVPIKPVFELLKERAERLLHREVQSLNLNLLHIDGEIVELRTIAHKLGVSTEALRRKLGDHKIEGYMLVGESLVSNKRLEDIDRTLGALAEPRLSQAIRLIEAHGITDPYNILSGLDYGIRWNGLDVNNSVIFKKKT